MFSIQDNWLLEDGVKVPQIKNPNNKFGAGSNICDILVLHYTASGSAKSANNNFLNPSSQVSWHLTLDRDGSLTQLYDFRKITWHAGQSSWTVNGRAYNGLNKYAVGIEIVNFGPLTEKDGNYYSWTNTLIPQEDVFIDAKGKAWQAFADIQIETIKELAPVIFKQYNMVDVVGHEHIAPTRKQDPGPAFWDVLNDIRADLGFHSL